MCNLADSEIIIHYFEMNFIVFFFRIKVIEVLLPTKNKFLTLSALVSMFLVFEQMRSFMRDWVESFQLLVSLLLVSLFVRPVNHRVEVLFDCVYIDPRGYFLDFKVFSDWSR